MWCLQVLATARTVHQLRLSNMEVLYKVASSLNSPQQQYCLLCVQIKCVSRYRRNMHMGGVSLPAHYKDIWEAKGHVLACTDC